MIGSSFHIRFVVCKTRRKYTPFPKKILYTRDSPTVSRYPALVVPWESVLAKSSFNGIRNCGNLFHCSTSGRSQRQHHSRTTLETLLLDTRVKMQFPSSSNPIPMDNRFGKR